MLLTFDKNLFENKNTYQSEITLIIFFNIQLLFDTSYYNNFLTFYSLNQITKKILYCRSVNLVELVGNAPTTPPMSTEYSTFELQFQKLI
jgi:hypothetical protein